MIANLPVLKTFVAVLDEGSVVAAARARGYSPAAVSRQMAWLQRRLGVRLFVPEGRSIRPTPAALDFAAQCRDLLTEVGHFEAFARRFRDQRVRSLP